MEMRPNRSAPILIGNVLRDVVTGATRLRNADRAVVILVGVAALGHPSAAMAQAQITEGYTLPDPSSTATPKAAPAPQGPVDERAGVPIAPRVIPDQTGETTIRRALEPSSDQPARSTARTEPTRRRGPVGPALSAAPAAAPVPTPPRRSSAQPAPDTGGAGRASAGEPTRTAPVADGPGFNILADPRAPADPTNRETARGDMRQMSPGGASGYSGFPTTRTAIAIAAVLLLVAGAMITVLAGKTARRRRSLAAPNHTGARSSSDSVKPTSVDRKTVAATGAPSDERVAPASAPRPPRPAQVDLACNVTSASRSVMMFSVDLRVELANRSDHAARDIEICAQLVSARDAGMGAQARAPGKPIASVARIGPHQNRQVTTTLQLALREVLGMRQAGKPIFVPVLLLTLQQPGEDPRLSRFVIGSPSATNQGRLHPLPLDGPPGSMRGLRVERVRERRRTGELANAHATT